MSALGSFLIKQVGRKAAKRFEAATQDPLAAQQRKLMEIIELNKDTEYGREYDFASIRNLEDYRAKVPLITYENIKERMDRVVSGAKNVLTARCRLTRGCSGARR
jgi:hypothetical protein